MAGADTVMMGSILAGTEESPGEKIIYQGRQYVTYRGMGSLAAMQTGQGSRKRYGPGRRGNRRPRPAGRRGHGAYAGTVEKVMTQFCGGLRLALGYCGCRISRNCRRAGKFVRISPAGVAEGHAHDVKITKEAPNYRELKLELHADADIQRRSPVQTPNSAPGCARVAACPGSSPAPAKHYPPANHPASASSCFRFFEKTLSTSVLKLTMNSTTSTVANRPSEIAAPCELLSEKAPALQARRESQQAGERGSRSIATTFVHFVSHDRLL